MKHEDFFAEHKGRRFPVFGDYSQQYAIFLEDLYKQFKARMLAEMKAEAQEAQRRYMDIRMKMPRKKEG